MLCVFFFFLPFSSDRMNWQKFVSPSIRIGSSLTANRSSIHRIGKERSRMSYGSVTLLSFSDSSAFTEFPPKMGIETSWLPYIPQNSSHFTSKFTHRTLWIVMKKFMNANETNWGQAIPITNVLEEDRVKKESFLTQMENQLKKIFRKLGKNSFEKFNFSFGGIILVYDK